MWDEAGTGECGELEWGWLKLAEVIFADLGKLVKVPSCRYEVTSHILLRGCLLKVSVQSIFIYVCHLVHEDAVIDFNYIPPGQSGLQSRSTGQFRCDQFSSIYNKSSYLGI